MESDSQWFWDSKCEKILVLTEMGEFLKFRTRIRLFDQSKNSFLHEIWLHLYGDLGIEYF